MVRKHATASRGVAAVPPYAPVIPTRAKFGKKRLSAHAHRVILVIVLLIVIFFVIFIVIIFFILFFAQSVPAAILRL